MNSITLKELEILKDYQERLLDSLKVQQEICLSKGNYFEANDFSRSIELIKAIPFLRKQNDT